MNGITRGFRVSTHVFKALHGGSGLPYLSPLWSRDLELPEVPGGHSFSGVVILPLWAKNSSAVCLHLFSFLLFLSCYFHFLAGSLPDHHPTNLPLLSSLTVYVVRESVLIPGTFLSPL